VTVFSTKSPQSFRIPTGCFHTGFWKAAEFVFNSTSHYLLTSAVSSGTVHFVGHSYGGAVASILCVMMACSGSPRPFRGWSYGAPPSMDSAAASIIARNLFNVSNGCDFVPILGFTPLPVLLSNSPNLVHVLCSVLESGRRGCGLADDVRSVFASFSDVLSNSQSDSFPAFVLGFLTPELIVSSASSLAKLLSNGRLVAAIAGHPYAAAIVCVAVALAIFVATCWPTYVPAGIVVHIGTPAVPAQVIEQRPWPTQSTATRLSSQGCVDHASEEYTRSVIAFIGSLGLYR
jgi:hypothetical protein